MSTSPHIIVEARAGTGKTFTLVEGLNRLFDSGNPKVIPSDQQTAIWDAMQVGELPKTAAFVAFNKSIAEELGRKIPSNCGAMTLHSLGRRLLQNACGNVELDTRKSAKILADIYSLDVWDVIAAHSRARKIQGSKQRMAAMAQAEHFMAVLKLVELCKFHLYSEPNDRRLLTLAEHYCIDGLITPDDVRQVLDIARKDPSTIDFADMIYLPIALDVPIQRYDLLLVDEAQDLNPCQQELAFRVGKRLILVGDSHQAIYGFAGADVHSIQNMREKLGGTEAGVVTYPLTASRRCGRAIVKLAAKTVPDFTAHPTVSDGQILTMSDKNMDPVAGDMVVCRVNAPLMSKALWLISGGKKAQIIGRDICEGLIKLIESFGAITVEDILISLEAYEKREEKKFRVARVANKSGMIVLRDKCACIRVMTAGVDSAAAVVNKIRMVFSPTKGPSVRLSSIHRAKGLEADCVWLLYPHLLPHPMATVPWELEQEKNLEYVAITRAKHVLVMAVDDFEEKSARRER